MLYSQKCVNTWLLYLYVFSLKLWAWKQIWSPFAVIPASTLLGWLSTCLWNMALGICAHWAMRSLVKLATDVKCEHLADSWGSNSSQRHSLKLRSGLGRLELFHINLGKPHLPGPCFVNRPTVMLKKVWALWFQWREILIQHTRQF